MIKIKLNAFTILEALISLILSSIIISLTYAFLTLISQQMTLFQKENTTVIGYNLFNSTIISDINEARSYSLENNELTLTYYNSLNITYKFNRPKIKRINSSGQEDVFQVDFINYNYRVNKKQKKDELQLKLQLLEELIITHYFLPKDNTSFINKQIFNED